MEWFCVGPKKVSNIAGISFQQRKLPLDFHTPVITLFREATVIHLDGALLRIF